MKNLLTVLMVCVVATCSQAALLSGNLVSDDTTFFPVGTEAIATGATYQWLAGSDTGITGGDAALDDMIDGVGAAGGGDYATFSNWDGGTSYLEFDLKDVYEVTSAAVYTNLAWPNVGLPGLDVETSVDGINYTYFGQWLENPANATDALATVNGDAIDARYVKFTFKRVVDYPGIAGRPNWSHQYVIGEAMVYGVPEPATLTILVLGGLGLVAKRRK